MCYQNKKMWNMGYKNGECIRIMHVTFVKFKSMERQITTKTQLSYEKKVNRYYYIYLLAQNIERGGLRSAILYSTYIYTKGKAICSNALLCENRLLNEGGRNCGKREIENGKLIAPFQLSELGFWGNSDVNMRKGGAA